jgi:diacylglycerol kinase family enzyme
VKPYRTRKIKILRAQNAAISLDGRQLYADCPLDVRILPEALTLIIPK